jgi:hypothetical protein
MSNKSLYTRQVKAGLNKLHELSSK